MLLVGPSQEVKWAANATSPNRTGSASRPHLLGLLETDHQWNRGKMLAAHASRSLPLPVGVVVSLWHAPYGFVLGRNARLISLGPTRGPTSSR